MRGLFLARVALVVPLLILLSAVAGGQERNSESQPPQELRIPNRPSAPLFRGKGGKQRPELHYDPSTHVVTLKLLVQDPNGYFIPNIRRENFAVYENGVRQQNATVEVEQAPVSLALLMEFGGRTPGLNRDLGQEVSRAGQQLLDELGRDDKIAVWKYSDKLEKLSDFSQGHDDLVTTFLTMGNPPLSDADLFDAIVNLLPQLRPVAGRKAMVLVSSGIDSFSKAKFEDVIKIAQGADAPIYALSLAPALRQLMESQSHTVPKVQIDWSTAEKQIEQIAAASGGRTYAPENTIDLTPIYDDMLENLKIRYVIMYRSSTNADPTLPRTVRVELVNPKTGGPLKIVDSSGREITARVIAQDKYVPGMASQQ